MPGGDDALSAVPPELARAVIQHRNSPAVIDLGQGAGKGGDGEHVEGKGADVGDSAGRCSEEGSMLAPEGAKPNKGGWVWVKYDRVCAGTL